MLAWVLLAAGAAQADDQAQVRAQAEMSLVATGSIDIGPDGKVIQYRLDEVEKLPPVVTRLMDRASASWMFEPVMVDGRPARARTKMSLRFIANKADGGFQVRIASANFQVDTPPEERPTSRKKVAPEYPERAALSGMGGTVYVVVRIGRDGKVEEAVAEQVNLRAVDREKAMEGWRRTLAAAALRAARSWKFQPPTRGEEVDNAYWRVRIPFDFFHRREADPQYGQWVTYIPGPRATAPWMEDGRSSLGADALAGGDFYLVGKGPRLLTPLEGS